MYAYNYEWLSVGFAIGAGFGASAAALRFSAAPGAEAKIRAGALAPGLYGPQFVNPKLFGKK